MNVFQRLVQTFCLVLFAALIWLAAFPLPSWAPVDAFLRMDPLTLVAGVIAVRAWVPGLAAAMLILVLTVLLGRFFCGHVCPMGATLDLTDRLLIAGKADRAARFASRPLARLRALKHFVLFFVLGAAALGVSAVFLASPLSLITRLYALLAHPLAALAGDGLLHLFRPLALLQDWTWAAYAEIHLPRFSTQWFILAFFLGVFGLAWVSPRFWCRYLCPSGAILALIGRRPAIRRRVDASCTHCGACQQSCPMDAIPDDPQQTRHGECIVCQTCVRVCPVEAISFAMDVKGAPAPAPMLPQRRKVLLAGLAGAGAATLTLTGLTEVREDLLPGNPLPADLIRPPGSLPERAFLQRCIRCGLCMRACPTNTLQPLWLQAGVAALFSPNLTPRRGPCLPECTVCGHVCPTGAVRSLPLEEKIWAKVGTAHILRHKCLAWEWQKKCLVCDEVCPYDAVELRRVPEVEIPVPFVRGEKCSGCGYCEFHCPVRGTSAIVVEPMEPMRLAAGSYREAGQAVGLDLRIDREDTIDQDKAEQVIPDMSQPPPGFDP